MTCPQKGFTYLSFHKLVKEVRFRKQPWDEKKVQKSVSNDLLHKQKKNQVLSRLGLVSLQLESGLDNKIRAEIDNKARKTF